MCNKGVSSKTGADPRVGQGHMLLTMHNACDCSIELKFVVYALKAIKGLLCMEPCKHGTERHP